MPKDQVKMSDIARELGISTVAVSKALSGQKGVSDELRARVHALAEEMGYQSPSQRRAERSRTGFTVGILIPQRYLDSSETFYWKLYQETAAAVLARGCFVMLEILSEEDAQKRVFPRMTEENKADGVIILGKPPFGYAHALRAHWPRPTVFLDFYASDIASDAVISNSYYGTYALTRYLLERGHRDIGFVGTVTATDSIMDRYMGYRKALVESGIAPRDDWRVEDRDPVSGDAVEVMRLPAEMPTAFVCNCDMMARVLIHRLEEAGYRVPEDVSVVGFDDYLSGASSAGVGITTYSADMPEMARVAVKAIVRHLSGDNYRPGMRVTGGRLIERESVCDLRPLAE